MKAFRVLLSLMLLGSVVVHADPSAPSESYQYGGARFRDPFVPLGGSNVSVSFAEDGSFEMEGLQVKGILEDKSGSRLAIVVSGGGASFMVHRGKILDGRGKAVPGITGVVKKKSVVLITSQKEVKEVKFEATEESGAIQ